MQFPLPQSKIDLVSHIGTQLLFGEFSIQRYSMEGLNSQALKTFVQSFMETSVKTSLIQYIGIPNQTRKSYTEADWKKVGVTNQTKGGYQLIEEAATHITNWVKGLNLKGAHVTLKKREDKSITPLILIVIDGDQTFNKEDTLFFYGHLDKQPPMNDKGQWHHGTPTNPEIVMDPLHPTKTKLIYGRGGADDGYSTYATMTAIKGLQDQGIKLPKIVMITECDEETGNGDVEEWLEELQAEFGVPKLVFCLDSGTLDYDRFWVTNTLRGYCMFSLSVKVLQSAVHSGSGTGLIPTCHRIIRMLLNRVENLETGVMELLDVPIPLKRQQEIIDLAAELGQNAITSYPTVPGLQRPFPGVVDSIKLNTWQAQLQTLNIVGYPATLEESSNIVTPHLECTFSVRLPPTKDHRKARDTLVNLMTKDVPYNAEVKLIGEPASDNGFDAPEVPQWLDRAFEDSSQEWFNSHKYLSMGQGGSIPLMNTLRGMWPDAQFVVTGVLGPNSNAHGPDECLNFEYLKKLTCCFASIIYKSIPEFHRVATIKGLKRKVCILKKDLERRKKFPKGKARCHLLCC